MSRNNNGLDLSGVGGKRLKVGGGSRPRPGLSFSNQPSLNSNRSQKVMPGSGQLSSNAYSQGGAKARRTRLFVALGIFVALAITVGVGVGVYTYTKQHALKPVVSSSVAQTALVSEEDDEVVWSLYLAVEDSQDSEGNSVDKACVVAADPSNEKLSYLWIPNTVQMYVAGYGYKSVSGAYGISSIDTYVRSVSDLTGISFNHYFVQSEKSLESYLSEQSIDASQSRETVVSAVTRKLLDSSSTQATAQITSFQDCTATDLDSDGLTQLIKSMSGLDISKNLFCEEMPLAEETTEEGFAKVDAGQWATMVKRVSEGLDPIAGEEEIEENEKIRSGCRVTIWNGVGVSGIAGDCADHLESKGWSLESTGNAASFVYDETLVIYNYESELPIAELLVSDLGQGRVVRSAARYSFEGDVLVVVGKDYQPY